MNKHFFYKTDLIMTDGVFRPRNETEQFVDLAKKYTISWILNSTPKILEIGTGSGAIAVSWGKIFPKHNITVTDIKWKTLKCAEKNFKKQNVKCKLILSDLFEKITKKYDVILANLPYVGTNFPLSSEVKLNDPNIALYGGKDGLKLFRKFFKKVNFHLKKHFLIGLEIGFDQKKALEKIARLFLPDCNFIFEKDYAGQDRFMFVYDKR